MAYINRENFIQVLAHENSNTEIGRQYYGAIYQKVMNFPTADVVEVVRCKDCKYYKPYAKPVEDFDGKCIVRECETDENEFCSYGTPKERGGEK